MWFRTSQPTVLLHRSLAHQPSLVKIKVNHGYPTSMQLVVARWTQSSCCKCCSNQRKTHSDKGSLNSCFKLRFICFSRRAGHNMKIFRQRRGRCRTGYIVVFKQLVFCHCQKQYWRIRRLLKSIYRLLLYFYNNNGRSCQFYDVSGRVSSLTSSEMRHFILISVITNVQLSSLPSF